MWSIGSHQVPLPAGLRMASELALQAPATFTSVVVAADWPSVKAEEMRTPARADAPLRVSSSGLHAVAALVSCASFGLECADPAHRHNEFRPAAGIIVREARLADPVRVERLIVALRHAWNGLPEVRQLKAPQRDELWSGLLTECIEEFYTPASA